MIIAGWILAILGLAQVVFAGTIEVSQLTEGNRLIGLAPSVVANVDLVGQRAMIHTGGCATFLAGNTNPNATTSTASRRNTNTATSL